MSPAQRRIIDATMEVLAENGPQDLTMSEVASRAGVSAGTLYRYFADKKELVASAHDEFLARIEAGSDFADLHGDVDDLTFIRALVAHLLRLLQRHERLIRAFIVQAAIDPWLHERGAEQTRALSRAFKSQIMLRRHSFGNNRAEIAADVCFHLIYDTASRRASHGAAFAIEHELSSEQLEAELSLACAAYLLFDQSNTAVTPGSPLRAAGRAAGN
jgi:AcrR family transcriptional regulator